ncbi:sulfotransferase [Engelhardtia mirabilis]|uniref:Sulfotransferase domain protein n=1 Tax=Engelhardtia mirabilis TaxID=2528011 RepID=A0A518BNA0_9BACT|nr:hypothetical protein Pla133_35550 [Planctomycetes bacterium Pla133]QDV02783.1 hypothetical protein Pla86_35530 [Planctomycetes bacterium Pla86]
MSNGNPERNPRLDALLAELAGPLEAAETRLVAEQAEAARATPRQPVILIVGAPRSGTTVMVQWLQATGAFAVPTNFMARFAGAPGLAARLQQALFNPDFAYGDQLADLTAARADFESDLGKTRGALAANEFFFFWRRHLGHGSIEPLGRERLAAVDWTRLRAELAALESGFGLPFALKGLMLQYDLPAVAELLPEALFVHVEREPFFNAQSLLRSRQRFHGDERQWYSSRPPGSERLDGLDPIEQVAGQVQLDISAVRAGLEGLPPERWLRVSYEEFCSDTAPLWRALAERFAAQGSPLPASHGAPGSFRVTNRVELDLERAAHLTAACQRFP